MHRFVIITVLYFVNTCYGKCSPGSVIERGINSQNENTILNRTNKYRRLIAQSRILGQPKASNMKKLQWDDTLALAAQKLTNRCSYAHSLMSDPRWKRVGQNLHQSWNTRHTSGPKWNVVVDSWFDEDKYYKYGTEFSGKTGHYTQLVWADTSTIGCGYTEFYENGYYKKFYVCNFGPGGNIEGEEPYKNGVGCEKLCD